MGPVIYCKPGHVIGRLSAFVRVILCIDTTVLVYFLTDQRTPSFDHILTEKYWFSIYDIYCHANEKYNVHAEEYTLLFQAY